MAEQIISGQAVNRPTPDALTSSILDHATVVDIPEGKFGLRNNAGLWPSYNCLDLLVPTPTCADPIPDFDFKTFEVAGWVPGFEFAVHGGVQCAAVGLDKGDQKSEVERVFRLSEGKGIERALLFNRFLAASAEPGSDDPVTPYGGVWDEPTDITPAGASLSVTQAVAMLEGHAAANYVGIPTLHMPRAAVSIAAGLGIINDRDGKFYTKTGAKVAAGGGYDDPEMLASGQWTMYATGEVYIERDSEFSHQVITLPGDGSGVGSGQNGLSDNTVITLVERMFRVGIDCYAAQITASVWETP